MIFNLPSVLRDRAGEDDSGAHSAPYVHTLPSEPLPTETAQSPDGDELKQIREELKAARDEAREARENAKYWSERLKAGKPADPEPEPEAEPVVRREVKKPREGEKPEELLDDVSKSGLAALLSRGVITEEQFEAEMDRRDTALLKSVDKKIEAATAGAEFDQKMGREFPELVEDNLRVNSGEKPKGEMFARTAQHFRQMVEDSGVKPDSAAGRGLMYSAAKLAKKELEMEGRDSRRGADDREDREVRRRTRIEGQAGERGGGRSDDEEGAPALTKLQSTMAKNLGVSAVEMTKFVGKR